MPSRADASPSTPAATVVVLRDGPASVEVLMLRRNSAGAFGGMWVFPGGRVDPGDGDTSGGPADELAAARQAAVREAREEAGLAIAPADLVPFSHWVPPPQAARRFATWFFLAGAPDTADVVVDGSEIHEHRWMTPAEALHRRDQGEIELAPPTWVTLWRLAHATDVNAAIAEAARVHPEHFETHMGRDANGDIVAVWHGDTGYEDGNVDRPGPRHRLLMLPSGWRYERNTT